MVVVSRGHFPSQATTDEHRAPVPHVPTPARLEPITLASGTSAHLRGDRQPWMKHCSTSALAARSEQRWLRSPLVAEGLLPITYSIGKGFWFGL